MANFDLNLITTFVTLYETGSVTITAERLFVTQPSVSYALGKLRDQFDDVLFVRSSQGMQPTRLAAQLYQGFKEASYRIESTIKDARKFEPSTSNRHFRLAMSDLGEMALLPALMQRLNQVAPKIVIDVIPLEITEVENWLNEGFIDAAICSQRLHGNGIEHISLKEERYVCLMDAAHPFIKEQMTMEQFLEAAHILVTRSSGHGIVEDVLSKMGASRTVKLRIPHFFALPKIIQGTALLAILPSSIARDFCQLASDTPLKTLELPFTVPPFEVTLHWHNRSSKSSALNWFFDEVRSTLSLD